MQISGAGNDPLEKSLLLGEVVKKGIKVAKGATNEELAAGIRGGLLKKEETTSTVSQKDDSVKSRTKLANVAYTPEELSQLSTKEKNYNKIYRTLTNPGAETQIATAAAEQPNGLPKAEPEAIVAQPPENQPPAEKKEHKEHKKMDPLLEDIAKEMKKTGIDEDLITKGMEYNAEVLEKSGLTGDPGLMEALKGDSKMSTDLKQAQDLEKQGKYGEAFKLRMKVTEEFLLKKFGTTDPAIIAGQNGSNFIASVDQMYNQEFTKISDQNQQILNQFMPPLGG